MRRFTLPPEQLAGGRVTFDADESRHLARVLRLRPGDTVIATDGAGRDYTVRLESVGETATGTVIAEAAGVAASPLALTLIQGVPKGDKMEARSSGWRHRAGASVRGAGSASPARRPSSAAGR